MVREKDALALPSPESRGGERGGEARSREGAAPSSFFKPKKDRSLSIGGGTALLLQVNKMIFDDGVAAELVELGDLIFTRQGIFDFLEKVLTVAFL